MNTQIYVITMFIASFFVSIVSLVYMLNEIGPQWMVPIFCPILIAFSVITITLANKKTHCFDGIGLAWCLKRWRSTGLPQSFSREEVLAELDKRQRQNVPEESEYTATAALDRSQTYLQRRTDGWYVLEGTREGDWLNLHRAKLVSAFQTHRTGDLHGEISEASNKEQEVWDEQDDAFGL